MIATRRTSSIATTPYGVVAMPSSYAGSNSSLAQIAISYGWMATYMMRLRIYRRHLLIRFELISVSLTVTP